MRALPPALQAKIDAGAAPLCRCWRIARADGVTLGFTDHDRPIVFDGTTFAPTDGVDASALETAEGLASDSVEIQGALSADAVSDADLAQGLYDDAEVRGWLVDWSDPTLRTPLLVGSIGEIRRVGGAFIADIRSRADALNAPHGRQLTTTCDAVLGDARCGVSLSDPAYSVAVGVLAVEADRSLTVSGLDAIDLGWFSHGRLDWTIGANAPGGGAIKTHSRSGAAIILELWTPAPRPILVGDAATAIAGCDKRLATCRAKFANLANFRGFPHMPGDDWIAGYPNRGEGHDGASLFKR